MLSFFLAVSEASEVFSAARAASPPAIADMSAVPSPDVVDLLVCDVAAANTAAFEPVFGAALGWKLVPRPLPR